MLAHCRLYDLDRRRLHSLGLELRPSLDELSGIRHETLECTAQATGDKAVHFQRNELIVDHQQKYDAGMAENT